MSLFLKLYFDPDKFNNWVSKREIKVLIFIKLLLIVEMVVVLPFWGPQPNVLRTDFLAHVHLSLLVALHEVPVIKPRLTAHKASALISVLSSSYFSKIIK